jgi:hypothetical protein
VQRTDITGCIYQALATSCKNASTPWNRNQYNPEINPALLELIQSKNPNI